MIAAFARLFWLRDRYTWLGLATVYALTLVALPSGWIDATFPGSRVQPISFLFVAVPIMFAVIAGCDVLRLAADDGSCFPRLFKTLPLSNVAVAAPLLAYAATVCASLWALAFLVAWDAGDVDIVLAHSGSMLLQLAILPWVLAAFWVPIERGWLRSARGAAVWAAFWISFNFGLDARSMTARTLVILFTVLVAGCFAATQAAARDRSRRSPRASGRSVRARITPVGAFRSADSALRWYGWTHNRVPFMVALGFVAIPCLPGVIGAAIGTLTADEAESMLVGGWLPVFAAVVLAAAPIWAGFSRYNRSSPLARIGALHPILSVLPCTAGELAAARLAVVARWAGLLTALVALAAGGVVMFSGLAGVYASRMAAVAAEHGSLATIAATLAAIIVAPAAVVAFAANIAWLGMSGARWNLLPSMVLVFVGVPYLFAASDWPGFAAAAAETVLRLVPLLPILAIAKLAILAALISRVARRELYARRTIKHIVVIWLGAVFALALTGAHFGPESAAFSTALAISILLAPVLGFFAAPLALHANRCR